MDFGIQNKRALVTASGQGIGEAVAIALAKEGVKISLTGRDESKLKNVLARIGGEKQGHDYIAADLLERGAPTDVAKECIQRHGVMDLIVHNVGGTLEVKDPLAPIEDWNRVWQFNVGIPVEMNSVLVPPLKAKGWGRIVHMSSISAVFLRGSVPYASAKAALNAYSIALARNLAPSGIVVSAIMPGAVYGKGGHWERLCAKAPEGAADFVKHHMALGRLGTPEEVAPFVVWLCSMQAVFASGALVPVDGGTM